jgi:drug/metabolite transporter (DMT)-like permease
MQLFLLTAVVMVAFAANSVLNRMAVGPGLIDPVSFAVLRLASGALVLAGLVLVRRVVSGGALLPGLAGRFGGVAGLLVYLFGFSFAYGALDAGTGALVLFGCVQITMFAGAVIAREAVPLTRWAGAAVALIGVLVLVRPQGSGGVLPFVLMAAAGVGWGIYSLAGRGQRDALAATAANFILALPVGLVLLVLLHPPIGAAAGAGVWLALLSGAVTSGMGYALWYAIVPRLGAGRAAVAQLTVPVIAAAGGVALLHEPLRLGFIVAAVLVLGGVAMASRRG